MPLLNLRRKINTQDSQVLAGITQELYGKNIELAHSNKMLSLLRQIDVLVLEHEHTPDTLAKGICGLLLDVGGYLCTAIALTAHRGVQNYSLEAISSVLENKDAEFATLNGARVELSDSFINGDTTEIISLANIHSHLGIQSASAKKLMQELGVNSVIVCKLQTRQQLLGVLMVGVAALPGNITVSDKDFLVRVSEASGVAFDNKFLSLENQKVLKELARSNQKLKALDEAKDEFISMASHQLRTPLTSIKGYLSMVLEGDVGTISADQASMLTTAFTSAQRMVYLISDLLNVSRLQTGKFVIESTECYLPDVIDQELNQLRETIAAKGIALKYTKPKAFTKVMLDETKIRQVIMNFTDNALYYTPAGGKVEIALTETAKSIEFTVTDNGIGVPKAEQHKLFAKFYRAGNARKARPDGTGLGLFMAKKVIVASGGAIIFKTKEDKGSTFGFIFPKSKIAHT